MKRYYSTQRPLSIGTHPNWNGRGDNPPITVHNFDEKVRVDEIKRSAWGYVEYAKPLSAKEVDDYELVAAPE